MIVSLMDREGKDKGLGGGSPELALDARHFHLFVWESLDFRGVSGLGSHDIVSGWRTQVWSGGMREE